MAEENCLVRKARGISMQHVPIKTHLKKQRARLGVPLDRTFWTGVLEVAIYPIGGLSLLLTIPQVYDVWVLKHVDGISLITWSMWTVSSFFWFMYGAIHKAKAVMFMQVGWIILYVLVISGVLFHT